MTPDRKSVFFFTTFRLGTVTTPGRFGLVPGRSFLVPIFTRKKTRKKPDRELVFLVTFRLGTSKFRPGNQAEMAWYQAQVYFPTKSLLKTLTNKLLRKSGRKFKSCLLEYDFSEKIEAYNEARRPILCRLFEISARGLAQRASHETEIGF